MGIIRRSSINASGDTDNESIYILWGSSHLTRDASNVGSLDVIQTLTVNAVMYESREAFYNGDAPISEPVYELDVVGDSIANMLYQMPTLSFDDFMVANVPYLSDFVVVDD